MNSIGLAQPPSRAILHRSKTGILEKFWGKWINAEAKPLNLWRPQRELNPCYQRERLVS